MLARSGSLSNDPTRYIFCPDAVEIPVPAMPATVKRQQDPVEVHLVDEEEEADKVTGYQLAIAAEALALVGARANTDKKMSRLCAQNSRSRRLQTGGRKNWPICALHSGRTAG